MEQTSLVLKLILAVLPSLLLALWLFRMDKHEKEPHQFLGLAFLYGCLAIIPSIIIEKFLGRGNAFYTAFIVASFTEELLKFLFLYLFLYPKKFFNEPYDGIIYAGFVSLGFATIENLEYAYYKPLGVVILRMFITIPAHAVFGILMGYFLGIARFHPDRSWQYLIIGFLVPFIIHGLYDYFLFENKIKFFWVFSVIILIGGIILSWKAIQIHQRNSPFKKE